MDKSYYTRLAQSSLDLDFALNTSRSAIENVLHSIGSEVLLAAIASASSFARGKIMDVLTDRGRRQLEDALEQLEPIPEEEQIRARHCLILLFAVSMNDAPARSEMH